MNGKHSACKAHVKLGCGCKVCARPDANSDRAGVIPATHLADLEKFHARVHQLEARRHREFIKRPAGDGRIEVNGKRLTTAQVIAAYEKPSATGDRNQYAIASFLRGDMAYRNLGAGKGVKWGKRLPITIPRSKFHRHTRRCRVELGYVPNQYRDREDAFPTFAILDSRPGHERIALARCKVINAPIPERRIPASVRAELKRLHERRKEARIGY